MFYHQTKKLQSISKIKKKIKNQEALHNPLKIIMIKTKEDIHLEYNLIM